MDFKRIDKWEHFHHIADIGIRGYGASLENAFEQAAVALTAVITDPASVKADKAVGIHCEASDNELLFADWLNALVYEMATRNMLFRKFKVKIKNLRLSGKAWGEKINVSKHSPSVEVKGATYTALKVFQQNDGLWVAQCVVDV
jgi:tRNA nucleotidyltransferase (CCA-adding enzyme)